jgi:hypothetical protein
MNTIKAECSACGGTGLYCGFAEPNGVAVVCLACEGTGCEKITYKPFVSRKPKKGVHTVRLSRGSFVLSCGPAGGAITYDDFCAGKMPKEK